MPSEGLVRQTTLATCTLGMARSTSPTSDTFPICAVSADTSDLMEDFSSGERALHPVMNYNRLTFEFPVC